MEKWKCPVRQSIKGQNVTITHWQRGGRGGMHPSEGQKQVPSPAPEKWVPITKNPWSLLFYTPFSWLFYCACLFFQEVAAINKWLKKSFFCSSKQLFPFIWKNFLLPPFPPPFTQATAAKSITSPIAIFHLCTHEKKFFPPSTKKAVPMCAVNPWNFGNNSDFFIAYTHSERRVAPGRRARLPNPSSSWSSMPAPPARPGTPPPPPPASPPTP